MTPWKTKIRRAGVLGMMDMLMLLDSEGTVKCSLSGEISQEDESNFILFAASPILKKALIDIQTLLAPGESDPEVMADVLRETSRITDMALRLLECVPQEEGQRK